MSEEKCLHCKTGITRQEREELMHCRSRRRELHERAQKAEVEARRLIEENIQLRRFLSMFADRDCPECMATPPREGGDGT